MAGKYGCAPPDRTLVAGLRAGDPHAGDLLVARYYVRILAQMLRETRDAELARDLTQDTFEIAMRRLSQLRDDDLFAGWLHGIARNRARMERRARPASRLLPLDAMRERPAPAPAGEHGLVREALSALRPADRQLLVQQTLWEMPAAEIAASLGTTRAAAYVRLARAKERLKKQVALLRATEAGAE